MTVETKVNLSCVNKRQKMSPTKVAIVNILNNKYIVQTNQEIFEVTGANKGIGYAIVKGLCEKYQGKVYLTARDIARGQEAVKKLEELGLQPLFHQLDITDKNSIIKFRDYIASNEGGIDLLVNNAAIAYKVRLFTFHPPQTKH